MQQIVSCLKKVLNTTGVALWIEDSPGKVLLSFLSAGYDK